MGSNSGPPVAANFSLKMTAWSKLCCVLISFCCVVLHCMSFKVSLGVICHGHVHVYMYVPVVV